MPVLRSKASLLRYYKYDESEYTNYNTKRGVRYYKQLWLAWPDWADSEKINEFYVERNHRRREGEDVVVDHIVPINHPYVCGLHNEFNLQVIHTKENAKKSNKYWPDMWNQQLALEV